MSILTECQLKEFKHTLKKGINSSTAFAIGSVIPGVLLMVAGCVFAGVYFFKKSDNDYYFYAFNITNVFTVLIITLLAEIAAIVLFLIYKSSLKQTEYYRNELIVLRDLTIAMQICEATSDEDLDDTEAVVLVAHGGKAITKHLTQKSKMQEQIIETLLSRCSN